MGSSSKELLHLELKNSSTQSALESTLLVCKKDSNPQPQKPSPDGKPITTPVSQSQVLGKVRDFLGVISEANERLQQDAKDNSQQYDIEALTGNESEVIEMDLMLGIADLHTPNAVTAAESAVAGGPPLIHLAASGSESESEETSDEEEDDNDDESDLGLNDGDIDDRCNDGNDDGNMMLSSSKHKTSKFVKDGTVEAAGNSRLKKRPKIVEMS